MSSNDRSSENPRKRSTHRQAGRLTDRRLMPRQYQRLRPPTYDQLERDEITMETSRRSTPYGNLRESRRPVNRRE